MCVLAVTFLLAASVPAPASGQGRGSATHRSVSAQDLRELPDIHLIPDVDVCGGNLAPCTSGRFALAVGDSNSTVLVGARPEVDIIWRGSRVRQPVGRRGSGPGEYRAIETLRKLRDGRIVVYDPILQRVTWFSTSGSYLQSTSIPRPAGYQGARLSDDRLFVLRGIPQGGGEESVDISSLGLSAGAGPANIALGRVESATAPGSDLQHIRPFFARHVVWDVTANGAILVARNWDFTVEWFDAAGVLTSTTLDLKPQPVTREDVEQERRRLLPSSLPPGMRQTVGPQVEEAARRASKTHQLVRAIIATWEGEAWIEAFERDTTRTTWYRIDRHGNPLGQLRLRGDQRVVWANGSRVAVLTETEYGDRIAVYRAP